jgi:hypothetical protein
MLEARKEEASMRAKSQEACTALEDESVHRYTMSKHTADM